MEHGLSVSTANIAKAAGVSEGTIFKRFQTKEGLFFEAMCPTELDLGLDVDVEDEDVKGVMVTAGVRLIRFYRQLVPRMMRLWAHSGPGETPFDVMRRQGSPPPLRLMKAVRRFVEAEVARGRIEVEDPDIMARTFVASMHNLAFLEQLAGEAAPDGAAEAYARGVVDMLWRGIAPRDRGDDAG